MTAPQVFPFVYLGKRMRIVALVGTVHVEVFHGVDALGVERWCDGDLDANNGYTCANEWVQLAVLTVLGRGPQA